MKIRDLLNESTTTQSSSIGRPNLVAITRATTKLIYQDLVATQFTNQPEAALYGIKYLNPNDELSFVTGATYSGEIGVSERSTMPTITMVNLGSFNKGDYFKYEDVVFKCLIDDPFAGTAETTVFEVISEANAASAIRLVPDAANVQKFETGDVEIADAGFIINKWIARVKSRKFKTSLTVELAQDLESNGFNAPNMLEDVLATQMAEEINKDILQSLITVSSRFKVAGVSPKGVLDLSQQGSSVEQGRELYRYVCEMNAYIQRLTSYSATYVVASSRVAGVLAASGWLEIKDDQPENCYGVLKNGLVVYCDNNSPLEYVVVGVKASFGDEELVGSLFYAPYSEGIDPYSDPTDHVGAYKVINDPNDLQPKLMLLTRYALCVNPYTTGMNDQDARIVDSTNLDNFAGQSKMSVLLGVKLPKLS